MNSLVENICFQFLTCGITPVGKTSHFSVSKYVLTGLATCDRSLSCWRITLLCLSWYCDRFSFNVRLKLRSIPIPVWHEFSASNASNSKSSRIFSFSQPCRSWTSKSPLLKRWNQSRHVNLLRKASP